MQGATEDQWFSLFFLALLWAYVIVNGVILWWGWGSQSD